MSHFSFARLDVLRGISPALADELDSLATQLHRMFDETQTTVGAAGSASVLPAAPSGYTTIVVHGEEKLVPYYDTE